MPYTDPNGGSLSESDKDRIAELVRETVADPTPEAERHLHELPELEQRYAMTLLDQIAARESERGPDPVLQRIDEATGEGDS